ncbi:multidrug effflux MFS transporter [Naasia sp. SYSU D00948]|uniref:multidrug effflux MFS transporter n=1 Tax=Naasia sp. SYSU D00948 TaxID=2817379 RepID=UPI001B30CF17|nr:multidrug effflux MFS transporter [Naasia sp. SYSU D00948]
MIAGPHPGDALSPRRRGVLITVLGALVALGPFTIDLYLPAFPSLRDELEVGDAAVQLTLTATIVGFGVGQLLVGPWSDRVGRRVPLGVTTLLHMGACAGAALAPDATWLVVFRVLQGAGAAGAMVVAMALVRDLFGGRRLVVMLARMSLVASLAPIVAPVIGSQILRVTDWRGIFTFLAVYGLLAAVVAAFLVSETRPGIVVGSEQRRRTRDRYRALFTDRVFVGVAIVGGLRFAGLFAYLASSPFLFQGLYGFSPQEYGLLFAINSLGLFAGVQLSARLTRVIGPQWILLGSTLFQLGAAMAVIAGQGLGIGVTVVSLFVFVTACGFGLPMIQVLALAPHGPEAGTAASVLGAINFGLAGAISPVMGVVGTETAGPMAGVIAITAALGLAAILFVVRPRSVPPLPD